MDYRGQTESLSHEELFVLLGTGGIVVDVGAHDGSYSEFLIQHYRPSLLFAFEPTKDSFDILSTRLAHVSAKNSTGSYYAFCQAVSDYTGFSRFHIMSQGGSNSVSRLNDDSPYKRGIGLSTETTTIVPCVTIDDFLVANRIDSIDFLKVDVQNHEEQVLKGGRYSLESVKIKAIQFEYIFGDLYEAQNNLGHILSLLSNCGFLLYTIHSVWPNLGSRLFQADFVFVHKTIVNRGRSY
jgi:FkbM family methyltransferase